MHNYEWFENKAHEVHGDDYTYEPDTYVNTRVKMWMTHNICGHRFQQTPKCHLKGQGCPVCGKKYAATYTKNNWKGFLKSTEERFGNRYSFPNIEDEYENSHSKITIVCNICKHKFAKIACDFICSKTGGCWCRETEKETITYDELQKKIEGFEIEYFESEKNIKKDKVTTICKICGEKTDKKIQRILKGKYGCKTCESRKSGLEKRLSIDEVKQRMTEKYPSIEVDYSTYDGTMRPMKCTCKNCGYEFKRKPNAFFNNSLKGESCPKCNKIRISKERTKTTEQFKEDVVETYGDGKYVVLSEYTASSEKVDIRCVECGRTFSIEANSFLQGHGCPYHNCNSSIKEKEIADFIRSLGYEVYNNDRRILNGYELDIYVPSKKIAFEFDGIFWHNENNKTNDYHINKTEECEKNGVRLVHVFEDEWKYKKEIWKSMISNILGNTEKRIFARKCIVKEIPAKECTDFLNNNHIQGWCPSQIKFGLYYKDELVSVMTFGKSRHFIGNGESQYELLRFCNKLNTTVVGGASKLFHHFIKTYDPSNIVSYADRRWSVGGLYDNLGFEFSHYSKPNYYYVVKERRKNRFNFRKSILVKKYGCPEDMSEREFCKQQRWYRIYDCGTLVYKWFKKN